MSALIGQSNNKELIKTLVEGKNTPHSYLISGNMKSGKTVLSKYLANQLGVGFVNVKSIDEVREMINEAYAGKFGKAFIMEDLESMNFRAQEALLKILEEPPEGCYIILNIDNISKVKKTILNRVFNIEMELYSPQVLHNYMHSRNKDLHIFLEKNNLYSVFNNIGLLEYISSGDRDITYFSFLDKFLSVINTVSAGNSIKSLEYVSTKKEDNKIDLKIFLPLLYNSLLNYMHKSNFNITNLLFCVYNTLTVIRNNPYANIDNIYINFVVEYRRRSKEIGFTGLKNSIEWK